MGSARLVVVAPVPAADALVGAHHEGRGLGAHLTLDPPREVADLASESDLLGRALAGAPAVAVRFGAIGWFDRRVLFLDPDDPEALIALASRVRSATAPPIRPHLTVATERDRPDWVAVERAARAALPLEARVDVVEAYRWSPEGRWALLTRFALR